MEFVLGTCLRQKYAEAGVCKTYGKKVHVYDITNSPFVFLDTSCLGQV